MATRTPPRRRTSRHTTPPIRHTPNDHRAAAAPPFIGRVNEIEDGRRADAAVVRSDGYGHHVDVPVVAVAPEGPARHDA